MKSLLTIVLAGLLSASLHAAPAVKPQSLTVLFVGGSSNWEKDAYDSPAAQEKDAAARMASFEQMLKQYFTSVTVMHAKDYRQELSARYDVTVMDGTPKELEARQEIRDENGRITRIVPARYFTEDFSKPVLVIGELGERLGRRIGLKFDWYCLCLDAHALEIRRKHAIFHGPFAVTMTMEDRPTPEHAKDYEVMMGRPVPETVPMWRVQTKGYLSDKNFRIGMVARPWGFEDSPDAEVISGGVCAKGLDAVALGRHGNFFGWGFVASPEFMTDEAQTVLANAICYIAKFDGQGLIARKYDDRMPTKHFAAFDKYSVTEQAFEQMQKGNRQHSQMMAGLKKEAEAKQAKGEKLSQMESIALQYRPAREQTREEMLRSRYRELFERCGTDANAYRRYYDENEPYFYSKPGSRSGGLQVDEDAKAMGIANSDPKILAKCIADWERGENVERARRVLDRYTLLDYQTPSEWRAWYEQNKSRLFFTQAGGFVFMVNTRDAKIDGNDYARKERSRALKEVKVTDTDDLNPVSVAAAVVPKNDGSKELLVKFKIHPGYHLYSHVTEKDAFTPTKVSVVLPPGIKQVGNWQRPAFKPTGDGGTGIFTDEAVFTRPISGTGTGEAVVTLEYQCCDARICFPPVQQEVRVKI